MYSNILNEHAERLHKTNGMSDFMFSHDMCLFRAKKYKSGKFKIKEICSGIPSLVDAENMGDSNNPSWHYRFRIDSEIHGSVEILLSPEEFSSAYTFKKSILNKIPVLFTGTESDFKAFINCEMEAFNSRVHHCDETRA